MERNLSSLEGEEKASPEASHTNVAGVGVVVLTHIVEAGAVVVKFLHHEESPSCSQKGEGKKDNEEEEEADPLHLKKATKTCL